jgi:hypothetical protein
MGACGDPVLTDLWQKWESYVPAPSSGTLNTLAPPKLCPAPSSGTLAHLQFQKPADP